jgi:hypothetical protein
MVATIILHCVAFILAHPPGAPGASIARINVWNVCAREQKTAACRITITLYQFGDYSDCDYRDNRMSIENVSNHDNVIMSLLQCGHALYRYRNTAWI